VIKGAAFREFLLWADETYGARRFHEVLAAVPAPLRALVRADEPALGVLASTWYPAALVHAILDGLFAGMPPHVRHAVLHDACEAVVPRMIRGVYKLLFQVVASPALYARHIQRAWNQLHNTGERRIELVGPTTAHSTIAAWAGHHPALCEITTETMAAVFRAMRCRDARAERVTCVADGAPECRAIVRWTH
jgi:hypothetical protein